jgi:hypothetical protein
MSYFASYPFVLYKFGGLPSQTVFNDLSAYVDVVDNIKDNTSFYVKQTILDNERPDTLSVRLYGIASLYWTFFYMNDHLRERGWPLNNQQLTAFIQKRYSYTTITTRDSLIGVMPVGAMVEGLTSGARAVIRSRRVDFGQLNVEMVSGTFLPAELIKMVNNDVIQIVLVQSVVPQYNAIKMWRDVDGNNVDVDPAVGTSAFDTPVTFYEQAIDQNEELRSIRVIKPQSISAVQSAFREAFNT